MRFVYNVIYSLFEPCPPVGSCNTSLTHTAVLTVMLLYIGRRVRQCQSRVLVLVRFLHFLNVLLHLSHGRVHELCLMDTLQILHHFLLKI